MTTVPHLARSIIDLFYIQSHYYMTKDAIYKDIFSVVNRGSQKIVVSSNSTTLQWSYIPYLTTLYTKALFSKTNFSFFSTSILNFMTSYFQQGLSLQLIAYHLFPIQPTNLSTMGQFIHYQLPYLVSIISSSVIAAIHYFLPNIT